MSKGRPATPAIERFWKYVRKDPDGCWRWTGGRRRAYGLFRDSPTTKISAHRYSYITFVGPVPTGLQLHHECEEPICVNPKHLIPVTGRENKLLSSRTLNAQNVARTVAICGHPFDAVTTSGGRFCRKCHNERKRKYAKRRRQERRKENA